MLRQRIQTALVLVSLTFITIFVLPIWAFKIVICVFFAAILWEWLCLFNQINIFNKCLIMVFFIVVCFILMIIKTSFLWFFVGIIWLMIGLWLYGYQIQKLFVPPSYVMWSSSLLLIPAVVAITTIREDEGSFWLLYALFLVWTADTAAYFGGRRFGKRLLASTISPGKTCFGVISGILAVTFVAVIVSSFFEWGLLKQIGFIFMAQLTAIAAIIGDLWESLIKRSVGVKDSGSLLPGHGGLLDRCDSVLAALPIFMLCWQYWQGYL